MGRPRIEKEGYHYHNGYPRSHPISRRHQEVLHKTDVELEFIQYGDLMKAQSAFAENEEVLSILGDIQKGIDTVTMLKELDEIINLMMVEGSELPEHNSERQEPIQGYKKEGPEPNPALALP